MTSDILVPAATAAGTAVAAGIAAFRVARRRAIAPGDPPPTYVRLSAEDSDRVEKIEALLERLIALEERTQATLDVLSQQLIEMRVEQADRHGVLQGRLDGMTRG